MTRIFGIRTDDKYNKKALKQPKAKKVKRGVAKSLYKSGIVGEK